MELQYLWFFLVGFLLVGYFVLDGFDFGVGMSLPFVAKDDTDRRVVINTIGPVWDLNETWLIVAGACLFAAFPEWYSTMFSGFYLALLVILLALILRGVSFEYRHQGRGLRWTRWFDRFIVIGSVVPAFLWGVAFANLVQGIPLAGSIATGWTFTGSFFDFLNPYALVTGVTTLLLFFTYGLVFLTLKTDGAIRERARRLAVRTGGATVAAAVVFLVWTVAMRLGTGHLWAIVAAAGLAAVSLLLGWAANRLGREGWAFALHAVTVLAAVGTILLALFPNLVVNSADPANGLTIENASSSEATLQLMTWVAIGTLPLVLAYQGWTYWVFRKRITRSHIPVSAAH